MLVQQVVPEFCVGICAGGAWVEVASTLKRLPCWRTFVTKAQVRKERFAVKFTSDHTHS